MALIDAHAHIGSWPYWTVPDTSAAALVRRMDRLGIDAAAVASLRGVFSDWRAGNDETLEAARRHPGRIIPFAILGPTGGWSGAEVAILAGSGFRGIRLHPLFHSYALTDPVLHNVCEVAGQYGLPVVLPTRPMMNWRFATVPVEGFQALAAAHPRTSFLLSGPNYLGEAQAAARCLRECRNVRIEISCLQGFDAVGRMADEFGADRVLFSTGAPLHAAACNTEKFLHARLNRSARAAVGWENALRICGLKSLADTRRLAKRLG